MPSTGESVRCRCGAMFRRSAGPGRPRVWCEKCRPPRAQVLLDEIATTVEDTPPSPPPAIGFAVVGEGGAVSWEEGGEVEASIGFPVGTGLKLRECDDGYEIVAVMKTQPVKDDAIRENWQNALRKRRTSIEDRLKAWRDKREEKKTWVDKAARGPDPWPSYPPSMLESKVKELECEAAAYNDLAEEFDLPRIDVELSGSPTA